VPEVRTAVMILVEATWEDHSGTVQSSPARMENRSEHGACIRVRARIRVGARLSIQSHREQFSGVARYCRSDGKDFLVGIQKDEVHRPLLKPQAVKDAPKREVARKETALEEAEPAANSRAPRHARQARELVPSGNDARIETPIAERLIVQETLEQASPERLESPLPQPMNEVAEATVQGKQVFRGKDARKGRNFMKLKWFAGNEEELMVGNGNGNENGNNKPANEPMQRATEAPAKVERHAVQAAKTTLAAKAAAADNGSGFQAELLTMEDIYRAAGITSPRRGYSVSKVVEMLRSEHLRGQAREIRRAAVLMALDAAGVSVDEVLQDAKVRQEAIEAYATEQRKHAEALWARKAEENIQIQAELEQVKALYAERIRRNLDGVAREKATFGS